MPQDLIIVGAAGTGKTFGILSILHVLAADVPKLRVLICRQTRRSLTNSALVTFEEEILPADSMGCVASGERRDHRSSYRYPNRSEIVLGGMDNPGRITSTAWDIVFVNEAIELSEEAWETIGSRLNRPGRDRRFGWLIGDTNPGDPSHWLRKRIDDGRTTLWDTSHRANPAMHDGTGWTPTGADYIDRLGKLKGTRRKRYLEGLWAAGEGQWFETFDPESHVSAAAAYDRRYPVHVAVDCGVHTGAVLFQVRETPDGPQITVFADYYAFNRPAYSAAQDILALLAPCGGRFDRGVMDPSGDATTPTVGATVANEYHRAGLRLDHWPKYPGSVLDGLTLIESFVSVDPPGLLVHPDCTRTIEAFANYKRAKRSNQFIDRPEDPQHPYEEVMDALRGGLQDKYPEGRKLVPRLHRTHPRNVF